MLEVQKINEKAYDKLVGTPPDSWANYACRKNTIWDQTTSNMAESLNNMIGAEVTKCIGTSSGSLMHSRSIVGVGWSCDSMLTSPPFMVTRTFWIDMGQ